MLLKFLIFFQFILIKAIFVSAHGFLFDPVGRASAWRKHFNTIPDYDDEGLYCGGFNSQWILNNGKCGICGDAFEGPRDHEVGGKFVTQPLAIVASYEQGEIITVTVNVTANHGGFFVFQLCPVDDPEKEATEDCLNANNLEIVRENELNDISYRRKNYNHYKSYDNSEWTNEIDYGFQNRILKRMKRYNLFNPVDLNDHHLDKFKFFVPFERPKSYKIKVKLKNDIICKRCVFRWIYVAGNNWNLCPNSNDGRKGCGSQEEFRNCADIEIR